MLILLQQNCENKFVSIIMDINIYIYIYIYICVCVCIYIEEGCVPIFPKYSAPYVKVERDIY